MELLNLIKRRRSVRKYQDRQIAKKDLAIIMEAGIYAPNAGGAQRSMIIGVHNAALAEAIGRMNLVKFDRSKLVGFCVSKEQPSVIDDHAIQNGFYGAPAVCVVFSQKDFLYGVADAFCCADNMVLMATALGISSCIVARGEETFAGDSGAALLHAWGVPENYTARCFVTLGYVAGEYPGQKKRKNGRAKIVE